MTIQAMTNGDAALARKVAEDIARPHGGGAGVGRRAGHTHPGRRRTGEASDRRRQTPVVLADHSDRSGSATWLLREIIVQDLARTLIATIADADAGDGWNARCKPGDTFDMAVGGLADESAGQPCASTGTVLNIVERFAGSGWSASASAGQCAGRSALPGAGARSHRRWRGSVWNRPPSRPSRSSRASTSDAASTTAALPRRSCWWSRMEPFLGTVRLDALRDDNVGAAQFYRSAVRKFRPDRQIK